MAAVEEGQVIGCHSVDEWKELFQKATDSKKLVIFSEIFTAFPLNCFEFSLYACLIGVVIGLEDLCSIAS